MVWASWVLLASAAAMEAAWLLMLLLARVRVAARFWWWMFGLLLALSAVCLALAVFGPAERTGWWAALAAVWAAEAVVAGLAARWRGRPAGPAAGGAVRAAVRGGE